MKLEFSKQSLDFLVELDAKQFKQAVRKIFALLADTTPADSSLLKGYEKFRRADIGEYRIVYYMSDAETVMIEVAGKRNDDEVYKILERKNR